MTQINPYITFNGKCREAMAFYKDCLGGELILQPIEGTPMESQCPAGMKHHIMHSSLKKEGFVVMATDMVGPGGYTKGTNVSLALNCSSEDEIRAYFAALSNGGKVMEALADRFWDAIFGCLVDKYDIIWILNFDKSARQ